MWPGNTCKWKTLVVIGRNQNYDRTELTSVVPIYMYFLATCITVQSYPSFDLVQSPQVFFHLHVFPGHILNSNTCGQEIHVNGKHLW
jgi:hypothetical protein